MPADRPGNVGHLQIAEQLVFFILAGAGALTGSEPLAKREVFRPAMVAAELTSILAGAGASRAWPRIDRVRI